jgi:hypothetical protein
MIAGEVTEPSPGFCSHCKRVFTHVFIRSNDTRMHHASLVRESVL